MPIDANSAYNGLIASPGDFLRNYPLRCFGHPGASGPWNFYLQNRNAGSFRPGSILGTRSMHATESFEIRATGGMLPNPGARPFNAISIHMDAGFVNMNLYRLVAGAGNIMVTGQLSGCAFVMIPRGGGTLDVAHVRPQGQTGEQLYNTIVQNVPGCQIYGASATGGNYDSHDRVATVFGVFFGGDWKIFAQKQLASGVTVRGVSPDDYRIKSVYQIYPERRKLT